MTAGRQQNTSQKQGKPENLTNAGKGRKKGVLNKTTALLKDAILAAAAQAGGKDGLVGYLKTQASANPQSFLPLLGKVLPMQVTGEDGGPVEINITRRIVKDGE
ncbi:hypothetical protein [Rhizorhapis sp.]|uniref:hypothetical protein n=1 Tax=Rhizorhapis sp. TaxID=1968842 RepID=UPI002B49BA3A|nr:hypothetical protein [Rhizorhapis sp.]HKR17646.1 hypothetical protein [Rhizorhapis sp.]